MHSRLFFVCQKAFWWQGASGLFAQPPLRTLLAAGPSIRTAAVTEEVADAEP